jgi:uncharacterized protein (TIGR02118 family)
MVKAIFVLYRKPGTSGEEFRRYWRETHAPIAEKIPGLRRYVQNHALPDPESGAEPAYAGFAELRFDSPEALQQGITSPEGEAALTDLENFTDTEKNTSVVVEEVEVV